MLGTEPEEHRNIGDEAKVPICRVVFDNNDSFLCENTFNFQFMYAARKEYIGIVFQVD